ncbi:MAG TPA: DJ-1/PfpI family protein [Arachidicoccus sp.]
MKKYISLLLLVALAICGRAQAQHPTEKAYTHEEIMAIISKEENKNIKIDSVGILAYEGFNDLDFVGVESALSSVMGTKVFLVGAQKGTVTGTCNKYVVEHDFSEVNHLDVLIIPGGSDATYKLSKDTKVLNWIRKIDRTSTYTASVCNGAWILGATGLLKGKKATSHWYRAKEILARYGADYQNKRWVQDGKYWTSAGVSASIDMGLAMVMAAKGKTYAEFVQLAMEYDPQPPVDKGSKDKANPGMVNMMTELFDQGLGVENLGNNDETSK